MCRKIEKNSKICLTKDFFSLGYAHEKKTTTHFSTEKCLPRLHRLEKKKKELRLVILAKLFSLHRITNHKHRRESN